MMRDNVEGCRSIVESRESPGLLSAMGLLVRPIGLLAVEDQNTGPPKVADKADRGRENEVRENW